MEVPYNQEPFARPRYGSIVTGAGHGEQRVEEEPYLGTEGKSLSAAPHVWLAQFLLNGSAAVPKGSR